MDDFSREMMELKTLVTRTLEKKGVLAKIRAELRANVFEAIEEEDRLITKEEGIPPALLGSCNDCARQLHASPSGRLLTALICEYLDWAQLNHTSKVYLPECNLQKDFWKAELKEFCSRSGYNLNRNRDSGPLLLDVLEGFLMFESMSHGGSSQRRLGDSVPDSEFKTVQRPSALGRSFSTHASDRRLDLQGSIPDYRDDEYSWRYDDKESLEVASGTSDTMKNLHLEPKS